MAFLLQVDFQVKVCNGESYISVLTHQVRLSYASILALGSSLSGYETSANLKIHIHFTLYAYIPQIYIHFMHIYIYAYVHRVRYI